MKNLNNPFLQVFGEFKINGETKYKTENSNPIQFLNVELYVGKTDTTATDGIIRNLMLESFDL